MLRQQERILNLDSLLRNSDRTTAGYLATELEVSERTVRADIEFLRNRLGAPIECSRKKGYFYADLSWRLSTVPLTQGELFALTLGARMLDAYAGSAYGEELRGAIAQLAERLPEQAWVDLQQLAQENVVFRAGAGLNLDPKIWQSLERACQKRRRVKMVYFTATRNQESERELDPYVLHFQKNNPYVTGWCHRNQAVRDFRVDRVRSLEVLQERFTVHPTFDVIGIRRCAIFGWIGCDRWKFCRKGLRCTPRLTGRLILSGCFSMKWGTKSKILPFGLILKRLPISENGVGTLPNRWRNMQMVR